MPLRTAAWLSAICRRCGKTFEYKPVSTMGVYCSHACRFNQVEKQCPGCGETFSVRASKVGSYNFCSRACRYPNPKKRAHTTPTVPKIPIPPTFCAQCAALFKPKDRDGRFCSRACADASKRKPPLICAKCGKAFHSIQHTAQFCSRTCARGAPTVPKPCAQCGKIFKPKDRHKKYCSQRCGHDSRCVTLIPCPQCGLIFKPVRRSRCCSTRCAGIQKRHAFKPRPQWRGRAWTRISREVRARDGHTCQHCGTASKCLHAHHIIPWVVSHDSSISNLITLCVKCHPKAEKQYYRDHPINQIRLNI